MVSGKSVLSFVFVLFAFSLSAQDSRYMIFFQDKQGTSYDISNPAEFLGPRAVERRTRHGLQVVEQDLPVSNAYVEGVRNAGATVMHTTRWMNGVLVACDDDTRVVLESLPFVSRVEYVAPGGKPSPSGRRRVSSRTKDLGASLATAKQLSLVGIDEMHAEGYTGEGVHIALMDAGYPGVNTAEPFQHIFDDDRLIDAYDFVHDDPDAFVQSNHGTSVLSVIAGYAPDVYIGGAYGASFHLYITEDVAGEYRIEEYNWLFAAERADSAGADIISTSLGYNTFDDPAMNYDKSALDGKTTVIARAAQWASERGLVVVSSAGNEGNNAWKTITTPADNEHVLAVAATNANGVRSPISSIGPSADGRIKPDVGAMGIGVSVINPSGGLGMASGTSLAAPIVTGLLAGIWQKYPHLSNHQLLHAVRVTASQSENPDHLLGYGIPNFQAVSNMLDWQPQDKPMIVAPNPVVDTLLIRPDEPEQETCLVEIVSLQGQVLSSQTATFNWIAQGFQADFSKLPVGMYFLRVRTGQEVYSFKIVKL